MCLCSDVTICQNQTEIHVLQHRRERRHAFGTVRLLKICLDRVVVHELPTDGGEPVDAPKGLPENIGVLYPGPDSQNLESLPVSQRPDKLLVIDGTWSQAHRMVRDNRWLSTLPRYGLNPKAPSRYRIRKEPRFECLSTLESTAMALSLLEPQTPNIDQLLYAFETMVDRQLECIAANRNAPRRGKNARIRPMRAIPECLWDQSDRVIVVYGESAARFLHCENRSNSGTATPPRELAQWCAMRLAAPEQTFDSIIKTQTAMPSGQFLEELRWTESDLLRAEPLADVQTRWQEFVRKGDTVVAWNQNTLRMAHQHGLLDDLGSGIALKARYANTTDTIFGTIDDVIADNSWKATTIPPIVGRARQRLANAHIVAVELGLWARRRLGQAI